MNQTDEYQKIFEKYYNVDNLVVGAREEGFLYGYLLAILVIILLYSIL